MWYIWMLSNARSFDEIEISLLHLKLCFLRSLIDWLTHVCCPSLLEFLDLGNFKYLFVALLLYTPHVLGFCLFNKNIITYKKMHLG